MEEKIERILRSAGIESSPVDPSSIEALRRLVIDSEINSNNDSGTGSGGRAAVQAPAESPTGDAWTMASAKGSGMEEGITTPIISVQVPTTLPAPQPQLQPLPKTGIPDGGSTSNITRTSASLDVQTHSHNQIVEMLQMHTIIMMETQRKLDAMAAKVDALERHIRENNLHTYTTSDRPAPSSTMERSDAFSTSTQTRFLRQPLHASQYESNDNNENTSNTNVQNGLGQPATLNQHENENNDADANAHADIARPNNQIGLFQSAVETISKFHVVRIGRLFWTRSRGFVRPIDGALMFKLVFMLLVMTARMSRSNSNSSMTSKSATKLIISILMIVGGFLYHTKYLQFCYQFFWKDNIPMRVWAGEDVEADIDGTAHRNGVNVQVPRFRNPDLFDGPGRHDHVPPVVDAQVPNVDRLDNLRQNFIGGAIHPPNQDQNPILALIQDTLYLLGSFFFSILPMWQPLRPPQQQQQEPDHPEAEDETANNNPETDGQERGNGQFHAIPVVAPPPNVMAPAEDDDDDESTAAGSLE